MLKKETVRKIRCIVLLVVSYMFFGSWITYASTRVLVDGLHGTSYMPRGFEYPDSIDLQAQFPEYQFDYLTPDDFPIEEVIASGSISTPPYADTTIVFTVPEGVEMLYFRFWFEGVVFEQLPYIDIKNPNGQYIESVSYGSAHIENPMSGNWTIEYDSWGVPTSHYEICIGPNFFNTILLTNYDVLIRIWDDTWALFKGWLPDYSQHEMSTINEFLTAGGGLLAVRESWSSIALKPVLRLYSNENLSVNLSLDFPGVPFYAKPEAKPEYFSDFTRMSWDNIYVDPSQSTEILYEGKLFGPLRHLTVDIAGTKATILNNLAHFLHDIHLFMYLGNDSYCYGYINSIGPHEKRPLAINQRFSTQDLVHYLHQQLIREGIQSGLTEEESVEFFNKYHWVKRYLSRSIKVGGFWGIYRFCTDVYDDLIPLRTSLGSESRVRTMWVVLKNISSNQNEKNFDTSSSPRLSSIQTDNESDQKLVLHEYGVIEEDYGDFWVGSKEGDFFDFHFYDDYLLDETNNGGQPWRPIFHNWGNNTLAQSLRSGVNQVQAMASAPMTSYFQHQEEILIGDQDTYCEHLPQFPPGSFPAVAMGKLYLGGRIIGINDSQILTDQLDNLQFIRNCISWLEAGATGDGPDIRVVPDEFHVYMSVGDSLEKIMKIFNHGDSTLFFEITPPQVDWLTVSPLSGVVSPLDSLELILTFNTVNPLLPDSLETSLIIGNNDPNEPQIVVPVNITIRGDANGDGVVELGDVVYLITYLFKSGPAPVPLLSGDANCSGAVELGDVVYLITYLYKGGPPPGY